MTIKETQKVKCYIIQLFYKEFIKKQVVVPKVVEQYEICIQLYVPQLILKDVESPQC